MLVYTICAPLIGYWMDRYGPRVVLPTAAGALALALAGSSAIGRLWQFYLFQGVVLGLSTAGLGYAVHSMFLPNWFVRQRGLAVGVAFSGVGVGALVLFPAIQRLIGALGRRLSFAVTASALSIWAAAPRRGWRVRPI